MKVDAARTTFAAWGEGIVWAVLDSGIDGKHPHFKKYKNLDLQSPLEHRDFTGGDSPLTDEFGHGTHVAGILAGYAKHSRSVPLRGARRSRDEIGPDPVRPWCRSTEISGMAPQCKVVSFKVLDENGDGETSTIISALQEISRINGNGRDLKIHGVNLSVGYPFDPEWFACGHSPLCNEVNQLVATGVVVVVSAGNTGYGWNQDFSGESTTAAGLDVTINDPGNADRAVTVGATHRDSPTPVRRLVLLVKGPHWRRTAEAGPRSARESGSLAPAAGRRPLRTARTAGRREEEEGKEGSGQGLGLPGGQRNQHGGTARLGCDRRVPVRPQRVHRQTGPGQGDLRRVRRRPRSGSGTSREMDSSTCSARCSRSERGRRATDERTHEKERPMKELSGFPYAEVRFDIGGSAVDAGERRAALDLANATFTDVLVVSHGWNNDMAEARRLYASLADSLRSVLRSRSTGGVRRPEACDPGRALAVEAVCRVRPHPRWRGLGRWRCRSR